MELKKEIKETKVITTKETPLLKDGLGIVKETTETFSKGVSESKEQKTYYLAPKVTEGKIQLFDKKIIESHRTKNLAYLKEKDEDYKLFRKQFEPNFDEIVELGENWEEKYEFLINKLFWSGEILDLSEAELPRAMYFSYMKGNIDNQNFYLKKLITHLRNLESVELLGSKKITEIPYYNATEERDQQISFKIIPTVEDWEKIKKLEIKYPAFTQSDKLIEQFLEFYGINEFRKQKITS